MRLDIRVERDIQGALRGFVAPDFRRRALHLLGGRAEHDLGLLGIESDEGRIAVAIQRAGHGGRGHNRRHVGCGGRRSRFGSAFRRGFGGGRHRGFVGCGFVGWRSHARMSRHRARLLIAQRPLRCIARRQQAQHQQAGTCQHPSGSSLVHAFPAFHARRVGFTHTRLPACRHDAGLAAMLHTAQNPHVGPSVRRFSFSSFPSYRTQPWFRPDSPHRHRSACSARS